ncbi:MAG: sigma-54 dependent transcriptional regulator [Gemmatimonadota bacterium]|nr:sigma-54 dependent transcriptional regulator [Gemmatimonadota bacterium]
MIREDNARLLIVDDDEVFRLSTAELLRDAGYTVDIAANAAEAGPILETRTIDLLLLDVRMPGIDGLQVVEVLRRRGSRVPILMISGYGSVETAVESLHLGADDFLTKPVDPDELCRRVAELLERRIRPERLEGDTHHGIVGRSREVAEMLAQIRQVAPSDATVLLIGETGTGKELAARAVHELSGRSHGPFVPVNCAALAEGLLESELFGHVEGAFTGAMRDKVGLFETADGGTLLLDEVGDMSLRLQKRLLRALQEHEVTPVGATRPRRVDVRVIAATHRDLRAEMETGRFREDLYYRLSVFPIRLPPLRDRAGDVPLLTRHMLSRLSERSTGPVPSALSRSAMRTLREHAWPGNVRELLSVIESAAIRAGGGTIGLEHLPVELRSLHRQLDRYRATGDPESEGAEILSALEAARGVRGHAASLLGMSRTTLWRRMRDLGLLDKGGD